MLICYLDDSGSDPQNSAITVAGYVATSDQWAAYEADIDHVYRKYGISILHAVDLHQSRKEFEGWTVLRKQAFVASVSTVISDKVSLGVSYSVWKERYRKSAVDSSRNQTISPYSFCSTVILNWMLTDVGIGKQANEEGISFIFEDGHKNNAEAMINLKSIQQQFSLFNQIRSVSFASKSSCRAIQAADLIAFYSRRHACEIIDAPPDEKEKARVNPGYMLNIITERLRHRAFVATDFDPPASAPIFLSDIARQ